MNFALLNKISKKKKEFDAKEYLDQASTLSQYIDDYFINEPINLLNSAEKFDELNEFRTLDTEISLLKMVEKFV
jgi:hypothetical protein